MRIKNWGIFYFVAGYHVLLLVLLPWFIQNFSWSAFIFFFVTYVIGGISITAGYHRLFSHKTYSANPIYEWAVLLGPFPCSGRHSCGRTITDSTITT